MGTEINRRNILLEYLQNEKMALASCSKNARGLEAIRGFETEFETCEKRCRIVRELIQALESSEVEDAMRKWQIRAGIPQGQMDELAEENMPKEPTPIGNVMPRPAVDYTWAGEQTEAQTVMRF